MMISSKGPNNLVAGSSGSKGGKKGSEHRTIKR